MLRTRSSPLPLEKGISSASLHRHRRFRDWIRTPRPSWQERTSCGLAKSATRLPIIMGEVGNDRILVTGSSGHLGEALVRTSRGDGHEVVGLDIVPSPFTNVLGSITDREIVRKALNGVDGVFHTAALQKPHIGSHSQQAFVETNVSGTLILLEEAARCRSAEFCLHKFHKRIWTGSVGRAGGTSELDNGEGRFDPTEHLRCHKDSGGEPL